MEDGMGLADAKQIHATNADPRDQSSGNSEVIQTHNREPYQ
ncbi:hypothetical protein MIZ03_0260 [Rhodoferax lithotrophicus]|uniref:Uncharacterized protein n=1 Tax=Rhodoferax lithotrophicus TaxID=2798804 RepID=A0ABN6D052_9BURK|nr:hypothetical protein MIZ03_0260 [Rhodoferax sp. MIZ03]